MKDSGFSRIPLSPEAKRARINETLKTIVLKGSEIRPLIMATEDLHWMDKTSAEFLQYLIDSLTGTRILLILLYRPEYTHIWGNKSHYTKVGVTNLGAESSTRLVQVILDEGEVIPDLRDLILKRAGGNPLFVEELTHNLLENGSIEKKNHQYVLTREESDIQVPDTLQGIIAARIDRPTLDGLCARTSEISVVRDALTAYEAGGVHAMHDATEGGVLGGIWEMCHASGVRVTADLDAVQVPADIKLLSGVLGFDPWIAISEGTLLAAVDPDAVDGVLAAWAGAGIAGMLGNAAMAQRFFDGTWYDVDRNDLTGVDRRETLVCGPAGDVVVDACRPELAAPIEVAAGACVWVNADCEREEAFRDGCLYAEMDSLLFRTGVGGGETNVHWALGEPLVIDEPLVLEEAIDIRPGSCPNPFNLAEFVFAAGDKPNKGGVLPVAILGSESFDVLDVDVASVRLEGVAPLDDKAGFEDVSRPASDASECACTTEGGDGYLDLVLNFSAQEIALALAAEEAPVRGETRALSLEGELADGTAFTAEDCVVFVGNPDREKEYCGRKSQLRAATPNPFNPSTSVSYYLAERGRVRISVYDVAGRLVAVLVDDVKPAGEHTARWTATGLASGMYFCRLEAGEFVLTQKIMLVR